MALDDAAASFRAMQQEQAMAGLEAENAYLRAWIAAAEPTLEKVPGLQERNDTQARTIADYRESYKAMREVADRALAAAQAACYTATGLVAPNCSFHIQGAGENLSIYNGLSIPVQFTLPPWIASVQVTTTSAPIAKPFKESA